MSKAQSSQLTLVDEAWDHQSTGEPMPLGPEAIRLLLWLNRLGRPATHRQIGWRWGRYAGRDPATCYRALRQLTQYEPAPLVEQRKLRPAWGNHSQLAVGLTPAAASVIPIGKHKPLSSHSDATLEEAVALTDWELECESTGWIPVPPEQVYPLLCRQQSHRMRQRSLTRDEWQTVEALSRMSKLLASTVLPLPAVWHPKRQAVRLWIHARTGYAVLPKLISMPDVGLLGAIEVCVFGAQVNKVSAAIDEVEHWSRRTRNTLQVTRIPHWIRRADPNRHIGRPMQRYGLNGIAQSDDASWFAHPHHTPPVNI